MNTIIRRIAIEWWNSKSLEELNDIVSQYEELLLVKGRPPYSLTGSEIEKIYLQYIED